MNEQEIIQAKQCALTTRDWDTFQVIVRTCLTPGKPFFIQPAAQNQAALQPTKAGTPGKSILKTL